AGEDDDRDRLRLVRTTRRGHARARRDEGARQRQRPPNSLQSRHLLLPPYPVLSPRLGLARDYRAAAGRLQRVSSEESRSSAELSATLTTLTCRARGGMVAPQVSRNGKTGTS